MNEIRFVGLVSGPEDLVRGEFRKGDWVASTASTPPPAWVCVASGTPGTWCALDEHPIPDANEEGDQPPCRS